jgi:hypothetical protein
MKLLEQVERHLESAGQSASAFGKLVGGDPRLVFDLRRGRRPRPKLRQRIEALITRD